MAFEIDLPPTKSLYPAPTSWSAILKKNKYIGNFIYMSLAAAVFCTLWRMQP